jgi:proteasome accessory factor C
MSGAADRLARLLALVPYLLSRPGARVEDVAREFGVSDQKLIDDLELLFVCGLPGHLPDDLIEASFEGGVIHLSNADTIARPLRLGADEALALLVGLRTLAEIPGLPERAALDSAIAKLERAAGDAAQQSASVAVAVEAESSVVPVVQRALEEGRRLHLRYYVPGRDEETERDVDPMRLLLVDGRAYLEGWCRRVEAVRLFRLDRVVGLSVLDVAAQVPAQAVGRDVDEGLFQPSPQDRLVTLELDPPARWVAEYYPCESTEELAGGRLLARIRTPDPRWVVRLALRLGGAGRVVDPADVAAQVRSQAIAALSAYDDPALVPRS